MIYYQNLVDTFPLKHENLTREVTQPTDAKGKLETIQLDVAEFLPLLRICANDAEQRFPIMFLYLKAMLHRRIFNDDF